MSGPRDRVFPGRRNSNSRSRAASYDGRMTSEPTAEQWPDYPEGLNEKSVSYREKRCTWHGRTCTEEPVKVVRTRDGARWAACAGAVRAIAAAREGATAQGARG